MFINAGKQEMEVITSYDYLPGLFHITLTYDCTIIEVNSEINEPDYSHDMSLF